METRVMILPEHNSGTVSWTSQSLLHQHFIASTSNSLLEGQLKGRKLSKCTWGNTVRYKVICIIFWTNYQQQELLSYGSLKSKSWRDCLHCQCSCHLLLKACQDCTNTWKRPNSTEHRQKELRNAATGKDSPEISQWSYEKSRKITKFPSSFSRFSPAGVQSPLLGHMETSSPLCTGNAYCWAFGPQTLVT